MKKSKLNPYVEDPECPKCGNREVLTRFTEIDDDTIPDATGHKAGALARSCCGCGYKWHTRCRDYEKAEAALLKENADAAYAALQTARANYLMEIGSLLVDVDVALASEE